MMRPGLMHDLAGGQVEGGEEVGDAVALVVMGSSLDLARAHRQRRLGPIEGLDAGFLIDDITAVRSGGFMYNPTTSRTLSTNWGSSDSLKVSVSHGFNPTADGLSNNEVADKVGCNQATVVKWRKRFIERGLDGAAG